MIIPQSAKRRRRTTTIYPALPIVALLSIVMILIFLFPFFLFLFSVRLFAHKTMKRRTEIDLESTRDQNLALLLFHLVACVLFCVSVFFSRPPTDWITFKPCNRFFSSPPPFFCRKGQRTHLRRDAHSPLCWQMSIYAIDSSRHAPRMNSNVSCSNTRKNWPKNNHCRACVAVEMLAALGVEELHHVLHITTPTTPRLAVETTTAAATVESMPSEINCAILGKAFARIYGDVFRTTFPITKTD